MPKKPPQKPKFELTKKNVRMVLHQVWGSGDYYGAKDVWGDCWSLRDYDFESEDHDALIAYMTNNGLIEESAEDGYHKMTGKGSSVLSGEDYVEFGKNDAESFWGSDQGGEKAIKGYSAQVTADVGADLVGAGAEKMAKRVARGE